MLSWLSCCSVAAATTQLLSSCFSCYLVCTQLLLLLPRCCSGIAQLLFPLLSCCFYYLVPTPFTQLLINCCFCSLITPPATEFLPSSCSGGSVTALATPFPLCKSTVFYRTPAPIIVYYFPYITCLLYLLFLIKHVRTSG